MNKYCVKAATAALFLTAGAHALSAQTSLPFNGNILGVCILNVQGGGTLAPSADYSTLSSLTAGGAAGTVSALTTGGSYRISAQVPLSFSSAPVNGNDSVTFATSYSMTGATTLGTVIGSTNSLLNIGTTNIAVNLDATKPAGSVFPAGDYATEVIVRCE